MSWSKRLEEARLQDEEDRARARQDPGPDPNHEVELLDSDPPNFEGHTPSECGEHRTVGPHRAWCHDCHEWCYPDSPCKGCELPQLRAEVKQLQVRPCSFCNGPVDPDADTRDGRRHGPGCPYWSFM